MDTEAVYQNFCVFSGNAPVCLTLNLITGVIGGRVQVLALEDPGVRTLAIPHVIIIYLSLPPFFGL